MAPKELKKGQKQIDSENQQTLKFYQNIILVVLSIYGLYIAYFLPGWPYYLLMAFTALIYLGCYKFMDSMVGGGMDLALPGGMAEHAKDLLLVTAIVQFLSLITNYALLIWLVVPARAFYLLWVNVLAPWFFAEPPSEMMDEKKQKKMERKMKRQQNFR